MLGKIRKFRHKDGFSDDTDFVAYYEDGTQLGHKNDGSTYVLRDLPLARAEGNVRTGIWVEIGVGKPRSYNPYIVGASIVVIVLSILWSMTL